MKFEARKDMKRRNLKFTGNPARPLSRKAYEWWRGEFRWAKYNAVGVEATAEKLGEALLAAHVAGLRVEAVWTGNIYLLKEV